MPRLNLFKSPKKMSKRKSMSKTKSMTKRKSMSKTKSITKRKSPLILLKKQNKLFRFISYNHHTTSKTKDYILQKAELNLKESDFIEVEKLLNEGHIGSYWKIPIHLFPTKYQTLLNLANSKKLKHLIAFEAIEYDANPNDIIDDIKNRSGLFSKIKIESKSSKDSVRL